MNRRIAVIAGAGPAGLTAAYELLERTDVLPIVLEMTSDTGGISRTVDYKGNKMDIGGHRFFSKSDRVVDWWKSLLPIQGPPSEGDRIDVSYRNQKRTLPMEPGGPDPEKTDRVMLIRDRVSRIFFARKFFDYPLSMGIRTLARLGVLRAFRIVFSYARSRLFPIRPEVSLRDFIVNRFGTELYLTFFRSYTEKVWGVPCNQIKAEWGAQRIKSLSLLKAVLGQIKGLLSKDSALVKKDTPTSLIEHFLYPKYGPGQMWAEAALRVKEKGGQIRLNAKVVSVKTAASRVVSVTTLDLATGKTEELACDFFFSTMAVKDLVAAMEPAPPADVREVAGGLLYRDFVTVGLLLKKIRIEGVEKPKDTWIYIQERDVKVGRLQIFNNWSPYLVRDADKAWVGLEYFCNEGDDLWAKSDAEFSRLAAEELEQMDMIAKGDVLDSTVVRMLKTYPAYFGTYDRFDTVRRHTDTIENLFLVGRNGMHRYNNQDHSMLTAMTAVDNIAAGIVSKDNLWSVNIGDDYHEEKDKDK